MKRTKKLLILLISVIALMSLMVLAVSAETVYAGSTITVEKPKVGNSEDMVNYNSSLSDTTVAEFVSTGGQNLKIHFLKPGTVTLTVDYTRWIPQASRPTTGTCLTKSYTVIEPDKYIDNLKTIKLESGDFVSGEAFPKFTVEDSTCYYVSDASFEYNGYTYDNLIPANMAGASVRVAVTLQPRAGYYFAWAGTEDGQVQESNIYTVEYNGNKIGKPYVVHDRCASKMTVYVDVAIKKQEIKEITISDLDAPYHNGPLDRTATVSSNVVLNKVQYTMFNKELDVFKKGDNVGIAVRVNTKDSKTVFSPDGRAYWADLGVYSDTTVIINPTEAVYVFDYYVDALESQILNTFVFTVEEPVVNGVPASTAKTSIDKYKVDSVTWSPADEKFRPGTEYTVKIEFSKNGSDYFFEDDFKKDSRAYINGKWADLSTEVTGSGRFKTTRYYAEYTFAALDSVFDLKAVGETEIRIYDPNEKVTLNVEAVDTNGEIPSYKWYRCNADGSQYDQYTLSNGTMYYFNGIPYEEMLVPRYYRCDAKLGNTTRSVLFSVTLCPMGIEDDGEDEVVEEEYVFPFTDVKATDWYYSYVEAAHQMGLINGTSDTTYAPNTELTVAAAVKLAVCMNILYNGGNPNTDISVGTDVWYSTYMDYALNHGIIDTDLSGRQGEKITRSEYVYIFSKALPAEAFAEINNIPVGYIPDVKSCNTAEEKAIYKFYRAGIVLGTDDKGTFKPNSNISRAEVATILVRMMDNSFRVKK